MRWWDGSPRAVEARRARSTRRATGLAAAGLIGLIGLLSLGSVAGGAGASSSGSTSLAQARRDLLVLSDMPAGWRASRNPNTDSTLGDAQLAHCMGVAEALITENPPSVNSPQFRNTQGTLDVTDNVTVFPSTGNAAAEVATASNPKYAPCMTALSSGPLKAKLFGKLPKGTTVGTPLISPVDTAGFDPGVHGFSMSVPITAQGVTFNFNVTQFFVVKGRLGHQVMFTAVGSPFSFPLEQQIMAVAARQL